MNIFNIIAAIYKELKDAGIQESEITNEELAAKDNLLALLQDLKNAASFSTGTSDTLVLDEEESAEEEEAEAAGPSASDLPEPSSLTEPSSQEEQISSEGFTPALQPPKYDRVDLAYKRKAVEFRRSNKKKLKPLNVVMQHFPMCTSRRLYYAWQKAVDEGGGKFDKVDLVKKEVWEKFLSVLDNGGIIHDCDLRKWSLRAAKSQGIKDFVASPKFIAAFKTAHRIVSRKITKFVTLARQLDDEIVRLKAKEFVAEMKPVITTVGPSNVYNTDQSGFNKELHSGRTLAIKGTRRVHATVQSVAATTHSYTIMPTISAAGVLGEKFLLISSEPKGIFGPRVQKNLFQSKNAVVVASKSGKLEKRLMTTYLKEVFYPSMTTDDGVILVDSYGGHRDVKMFLETAPPGKKVSVHVIPPGATGLVQPLDVFGFNPWKKFDRKFCDLVVQEGFDINISERNNIIKLQSLIHNQFRSPRYREMWKYSWWKAGYIQQKPTSFFTPVEFSFCSDSDADKCQFSSNDVCDKFYFLICGWCKRALCFDHFFGSANLAYHFCNEYVE